MSVEARAGLDWSDADARTVDLIRVLAMDAVERAGSGHPGTAMSLRPVNMGFQYGTSFGGEELTAYERLLLEFGGEYPQIRERHTDEESIGAYFGGRQWHRADFPHATELDLELLAARVNSTSYLPAPSDRRYVPMMQSLRDLFHTTQRDGRVVMQYDTRVYHGVIQT